MIKKVMWILKGSKMVSYTGFNCGCCGKWVGLPFKIPTYISGGRMIDTWGICDKCRKPEDKK